jgi:hypothetical protein
MSKQIMITPDAIEDFSLMLMSDDALADSYRCSYCDREVDSYVGAHDDAPAAMLAFVEHTAFDHSGRADILRIKTTVFARVLSLSEVEHLAHSVMGA